MGRRIAAILMTMLLFAGCAQQTDTQQNNMEEPQESVSETDSQTEKEEKPLILASGRHFFEHHPSRVQDAGQTVIPLVYEGLVSVGKDYHWEPRIAESIERTDSSYMITIREDAAFSNGDTISAWDVMRSMEIAMEEGSLWRSSLYSITDYTVMDTKKLRIVTESAGRDFENLLTFPIAKQADSQWIGSGKYSFQSREGDTVLMGKNPYYRQPHDGPETIQLKELPRMDAADDSLRIGQISCLFDDLTDGEAMNLSNRNQTVDINHIVFLGANCVNGMASQPRVRQAIHKALDRQSLADRVYASKARPTDTPFNPIYYGIEEYTLSQPDLAEAQELMEKAEFTKNSTGYYETEEYGSMTLLYNSENAYRHQTAELIREQLEVAGIRIELQGVPYEEYMQLLQKGQFDLYLGELAIGDNMDISRLFTTGEGYGYGIGEQAALLQFYTGWQQERVELKLFMTKYLYELPAIPLLYREGIISFAPGVTVTVSPEPGNIFAGLAQ